MFMGIKYKSKALESLYEVMVALHEIEAITDEELMYFKIKCML